MRLDAAVPARGHYRHMNEDDNRIGGRLLIIGPVAGIITMVLHPVAPRGGPSAAHNMAALAGIDRIVHGLALAGMMTLFLGTLALTRRLAAGNRLSLAALAVYGFAAAAIMVAGTMDGFVAASLLDRMTPGDPKTDLWWTLLGYNTRIVLAFAAVYSVGACVAIFLWSLAMVRTRQLATGLGWYGLVSTPMIVLALFSGHLTLDVHGMGLVVLVQAVWFITAGTLLLRETHQQNMI